MKQPFFFLSLVLLSHQILFAQAGTLDPTFGVGGLVTFGSSDTPSSTAWGAEVAEDGKIWMGGNSELPFIVRFLPNGKQDVSFADNGMLIYTKFWPTVMKALPGGKILLVGEEIARLNPDGSEDPTWSGALPNGALPASDCVLQADGKLLLSLSGSSPTLSHYCVARYLEDGSLDPSFGQDGLAYNLSEWSGQAEDMTVQPDGKILVTGNNGKEKLSMARYLPNGAPDLGFGDQGVLVWSGAEPLPPDWYLAGGGDSTGGYPFAVKTLVQPDGKILVAAQESNFDSIQYNNWVTQIDLYRLNPDGTTDITFGSGGVVTLADLHLVFDLFLQAGGKIQVAGATFDNEVLLQVLPNGEIDPDFQVARVTTNNANFNDNQGLLDFAQQPDGKIIAALSVRWTQPMAVFPFYLHATRLEVNGSNDSDFETNAGYWVGYSPSFYYNHTNGIELQPDGKILVFGESKNYTFNYDHYVWSWSPFIVRRNADGSPDPTWWLPVTSVISNGDPTLASVHFLGVASMPNGKTILAYSYSGLKIARFNTTAKVDSTFAGDGIVDLPGNLSYVDVTTQPDGSVLVAATLPNGATVVYRLLSNGEKDLSFGLAGAVELGQMGVCIGLALLPNGKIALAGSDGKVVQLRANGQFDSDFSNDGLAEFPLKVHSIAAQADGKIVLGAGTDQITIARIATNGSGLDATFGGGDGTLSFSTNGIAVSCISIALQPDGKIVATGAVGSDLVLARCTTAGNVDSSFNETGQVASDFGYQHNWPTNVAIQPDGKIVVGATNQKLTGTITGIVRYQSGLTIGTDHVTPPQTASMAWPNPFSNTLSLDFSGLTVSVRTVEVFDLSGRKVFQTGDVAAPKMDIPDSNHWSAGTYLLRATTERGVFVQKMVKQ